MNRKAERFCEDAELSRTAECLCEDAELSRTTNIKKSEGCMMNQTGKNDEGSNVFNCEGNERIRETGGEKNDCSSETAADSLPVNTDDPVDVSGRNAKPGADGYFYDPQMRESWIKEHAHDSETNRSGAGDHTPGPEKKESGLYERAVDSEMKESLGDMMQVNTPILDLVEGIAMIPARLLLSRLALTIAIQVLIPAFAIKEILMYAGTVTASFVAASCVDAVRELLKSNSESRIKSQLLDIFLKDGLNIHSFSKGGHIPSFLLSNLHLAEGFDGAVSGDLISLHYRDYSIVCCNIALTMSPVEGFEDSYTQDDVQARKYFQIEDNQNVLFYGSVFMFFPGPDIEGNVRLAAYSPVQYLKDLKEMDLDESMKEPEHLQQRMDSFRRYHEIEGEHFGKEISGDEISGKDNLGKLQEKEQVFTERVKDMILQLEWEMRAPAAVYAEKNIVCLTIQDKVYDFECLHDLNDPAEEVKNVLYGKIASFKDILDMIIGPKEDEYTELLGNPADQRKSVYTPFLNPFHEAANPEEEDIQAYVNDLAEWSADIYRFLLHYSPVFRTAYRSLESVSTQFLSEFLLQQDAVEARIWVESNAGSQMRYSLTSAVNNCFRDLWNASGKCQVRNIRKEVKEGNPIILFDIVLNPPIRKWNYTPEINRRLVLMCNPSHYSLNQLNEKKTQNEIVSTFAEYLKTVNHLSYDKDCTYQAVMKLQEGHKYAMEPEEISKFCKWYTDCMAANMIKDGQHLKLQDDEKPSEQ